MMRRRVQGPERVVAVTVLLRRSTAQRLQQLADRDQRTVRNQAAYYLIEAIQAEPDQATEEPDDE